MSTSITDLIMDQRRSLDALADILKESLKDERYPLRWSVLTTALYAEVDLFEPSQNDADRRAIFDAWCQALDATEPREEKWFDGGIRMGTQLRAVFTRNTDRGDVPGSLMLFIQHTQD